MSIRCGSSGHTHETAAQVRQCQVAPGTAQIPEHSLSRSAAPAARPLSLTELKARVPAGYYALDGLPEQPAVTYWQVDKPDSGNWAGHTFVSRLMVRGSEVTGEMPARGPQAWAVLNAIREAGPENAARRHEEAGLLRAPSFSLLASLVTEGGYATDGTTEENPVAFWRVRKPAEGRHAGRTFVDRVIGGQPDARVLGLAAYLALRAIVTAGPAQARIRFGTELGICGECHVHLTRPKSRAQGAGDTCYAKIMARRG